MENFVHVGAKITFAGAMMVSGVGGVRGIVELLGQRYSFAGIENSRMHTTKTTVGNPFEVDRIAANGNGITTKKDQ
jgi:hypothetical protein